MTAAGCGFHGCRPPKCVILRSSGDEYHRISSAVACGDAFSGAAQDPLPGTEELPQFLAQQAESPGA